MEEKELLELKDRLLETWQPKTIRTLIEAVALKETTIFLFSNTNRQ